MLYVAFHDNIPQYGCGYCNNCSSLFGTSLCKIKNRGCCFYFPKFTLYDIHKMVQSPQGEDILNFILTNNNTEIYHYYIHSKGYFEEESYNKNKNTLNEDLCKVEDKTIFFRACPFVKEGMGCTIPAKFRSNVCNFFICDEVKSKLSSSPLFQKYEEECRKYSSFIKWENDGLELMLRHMNLDLINNFNQCINILKDLPLNQYEFPNIEAITPLTVQ